MKSCNSELVPPTCTTSNAGAVLSPYSKPFTKPNSMGTRRLVLGAAGFTDVCSGWCSAVLVAAGPLLEVAIAVPLVCSSSMGASLVAGLDAPQPIAAVQSHDK